VLRRRGDGGADLEQVNRMKTSSRMVGLLVSLLLFDGCAPKPSGTWQGYIEGEFVYVAAPLSGTLTNLAVNRGLEVKTGQLLFELDREPEAAAAREAEQRLAQAKSRLENLMKGRRPTEIAALEAQLAKARASLRLSDLELDRANRMIEEKVIAPAELDLAKAKRDADHAQVESLVADLETARLGARPDEIQAAEADVQALQSTFTKAEWALAQKTQSAPTNAWVHDTLYRSGEMVPAGNPIVSLLPPANIKVRFFVPQTDLASLSPGTAVTVRYDGAPAPLRATVSYLSTQAEFTPPVIYSRENRAKLVFMVEAVFDPADARNLRPGQPVDVKLTP
jgi:HlyD family secretion protein